MKKVYTSRRHSIDLGPRTSGYGCGDFQVVIPFQSLLVTGSDWNTGVMKEEWSAGVMKEYWSAGVME